MELTALLASQFNLPSIPRVVALLLSELDRDEPDLKRVSQLVSTDPALTTRLLQISNSDDYKLAYTINSVSESLAILGLKHLRAMTAIAASGSSFKAVAGINLQQFWSYSLNVAKISRSLAGVVRQNQQAAFTCGLIHAVGELACTWPCQTRLRRSTKTHRRWVFDGVSLKCVFLATILVM